MNGVKVYGTGWCEDTSATCHNLDSLGVQFEYVDVEADAKAQAWVKQQNGGKQKTPTVDINGRILIEPSERELEEASAAPG